MAQFFSYKEVFRNTALFILVRHCSLYNIKHFIAALYKHMKNKNKNNLFFVPPPEKKSSSSSNVEKTNNTLVC